MATTDPRQPQTIVPQGIVDSKRPRRWLRWVWLGLAVVVIVVAGIVIWKKTHQPEPYHSMTTSQYNKSEQAKRMAEQARTLDPVSQAVQLTGAADLMDQADQYKQSLAYYLDAQEVVGAHNLKKEAALDYSEQIGDEYAKLGKNSEARTYYNKAIDFVKSQSGNPNQADLIKAIKEKRDKL